MPCPRGGDSSVRLPEAICQLNVDIRKCARSISPCVEAPKRGILASQDSQVYLRVCGGTSARFLTGVLERGLSPRVRRHPSRIKRVSSFRGSISACAEAPGCGFDPDSIIWVYLRVCGGTFLSADRIQPPGGLSPRVRRHLDRALNRELVDGSISACAEAPPRSRTPWQTAGVYLRVCGGTHCLNRGLEVVKGLSPRVRRHLQAQVDDRVQNRSISACAEAPGGCPTECPTRGVYLRVCGGTRHAAAASDLGAGLSPRVRRHLSTLQQIVAQLRSISACAEAPARGGIRTRCRRVYLRVCGGTTVHRWSHG